MTEDELAAIEARANAATPGPWKLWNGYDLAYPNVGICGVCRIGPEGSIAGVRGAEQRDVLGSSEDLEFIASARQDIPALIAEVRRLRDEVAMTWRAKDRCVTELVNAELERDRLRDALEWIANTECKHDDLIPQCIHHVAKQALNAQPELRQGSDPC